MPATDPGSLRRSRLAAARLYLICDSRPGGAELSPFLRAAIRGGVDVVQLRDKRLQGGELIEAARIASIICRELGALFIVNDDPEAALSAGADGVHVGQDDMPAAELRARVGRDLLVGLSTHARAEIDGAAAQAEQSAHGAASAPAVLDYIGVGPVFETPTKPGRPAVGVELVRYAAEHFHSPFFAVGGIDRVSIGPVLAAGARRVAVVRAIANTVDPEAAARLLRNELDQVKSLEHAHPTAAVA
jgi:thiamine-phosphate pyrophosphorylase